MIIALCIIILKLLTIFLLHVPFCMQFGPELWYIDVQIPLKEKLLVELIRCAVIWVI